MSARILYEETQRFRAVWLWALLLPAVLIPISLVGKLLVTQIATERPIGERPLSTTGLAVIFAGLLVVGLALVALFAFAKLVVRVEPGVLSIRFVPFVRKRYPIQDLVRWEVRDYRALAEYGGWGIRWGFGGKAYTVSGHRGVQLELRSGQKLLIGSQRPEELAAALQQAQDAA